MSGYLGLKASRFFSKTYQSYHFIRQALKDDAGHAAIEKPAARAAGLKQWCPADSNGFRFRRAVPSIP